MTPEQLRTVIVKPVLNGMGLWSPEAEELLLGTAAHESDGLKRITQYGNGPALSYFQMEPDTLDDLYENYLKYRPDKKNLLDKYKIPSLGLADNLSMNIAFAVASARLHYFRVAEPIPKSLVGQAAYWKEHWNTVNGKGTVEQYIGHYNHYIKGK